MRFDDFVHTDAEFHLAVVHCGRNTLLTELYRGLTEVVTARVAATITANFGHAEEIQHRGLLHAIVDKDPARAVTEAGDFLNEVLARLDVDPAELG
jgi:DNA-binding FadR family transcriptional regulator